MLINKAIETAAKAHDGQVDKAGEAYIFHPLRVMLNVMGGENVKCAAVLHDVMEDSGITEEPIHTSSPPFSTDVGSALHCLLRQLQPGHG